MIWARFGIYFFGTVVAVQSLYAEELKETNDVHYQTPVATENSSAGGNCGQPQPVQRPGDAPGVWGDFQNARYELTYDLQKRDVRVKAVLRVQTDERGYPLFDLAEVPLKVTLNGQEVDHRTQELPGNDSAVRRIDKVVEPGTHRIEVWSRMNEDIDFIGDHQVGPSAVSLGARGIESRFRYFDMRDRNFLEKYLPTNLEFDQYPMAMKVKIIGGTEDHEIFTNGTARKTNDGFEINFPKHFTASSPFFHLAPKSRHSSLEVDYRSIDGRSIPIKIYSKRGTFGIPVLAKVFRDRLVGSQSLRTGLGFEGLLRKMEKRFGPWPHDSFTVYAVNKMRGGMEYPGAAESGHAALEHEVIHNWFGRSVMPCDGDDGWVDEAIASWNDHKTHHSFAVRTRLVSHKKEGILGQGQDLLRRTPKGSYLQGRHFVKEVNRQLANSPKGPKDFDQFLRFFHQKHRLSQVTGEQFLADLKEFSGIDFWPVANRYIYRGKRPRAPRSKGTPSGETGI